MILIKKLCFFYIFLAFLTINRCLCLVLCLNQRKSQNPACQESFPDTPDSACLFMLFLCFSCLTMLQFPLFTVCVCRYLRFLPLLLPAFLFTATAAVPPRAESSMTAAQTATLLFTPVCAATASLSPALTDAPEEPRPPA